MRLQTAVSAQSVWRCGLHVTHSSGVRIVWILLSMWVTIPADSLRNANEMAKSHPICN